MKMTLFKIVSQTGRNARPVQEAMLRTKGTPVMRVELSEHEMKIAAAALRAVSPSGGGSSSFHLAMKLEGVASLSPDDTNGDLATHYMKIASLEYLSGLNEGEALRILLAARGNA